MATTDKYDRQLRLWGAAGQRALGETTVILLRATASGTETLKNLVLPGVGKILVVDDHAAVHDYASNFFVTKAVNQSRAQVAMELLQELNPDVQGKWKHVESMNDVNLEEVVLTAAPDKRYLLVIGADLEPPLFKKISKICSSHAIPLICVHSYGLIGSVRLQIPPLPLLQPKPATEQPDLRLVAPFPEFIYLADSIHLNDLDDADHGHVPYPILLYKIAQDWKSSHDGALPLSTTDKQIFRQLIRDAARKPDMEINFSEAQDNSYLAYTEKKIDVAHLKSLLEISMHSCPKLHAMITGLLQFMEDHDQRGPLNGTIPDMTSSTNLYVELQQIYHGKAVADIEAMRSLVPLTLVDDDELDVFCKNVYHLDLLQTRTILDEYTGTSGNELRDDWEMVTMDPHEVPEHTPFLWYIGVRACHLFFETHTRYPGISHDSWEEDVDDLQVCIQQTVTIMGLEENSLVQQTLLSPDCKYAKELARYANAEIHNIASIVGGVSSQEAVKIITGQYVPFNNTYIYNGIASTGGVYQL